MKFVLSKSRQCFFFGITFLNEAGGMEQSEVNGRRLSNFNLWHRTSKLTLTAINYEIKMMAKYLLSEADGKENVSRWQETGKVEQNQYSKAGGRKNKYIYIPGFL